MRFPADVHMCSVQFLGSTSLAFHKVLFGLDQMRALNLESSWRRMLADARSSNICPLPNHPNRLRFSKQNYSASFLTYRIAASPNKLLPLLHYPEASGGNYFTQLGMNGSIGHLNSTESCLINPGSLNICSSQICVI